MPTYPTHSTNEFNKREQERPLKVVKRLTKNLYVSIFNNEVIKINKNNLMNFKPEKGVKRSINGDPGNKGGG